MRLFPILLALAAGMALPVQAEVPRVVASTKPLHALVATTMGELGTPGLIVDGSNSPHTYSLKPSDAEVLEAADLVFWTGPDFELFLRDALPSLAAEAEVVALAETAGLALLPVREGGAFEEHADDAAHGEHGHGETDMHFWLDPQNGQLMLDAIAATLAAADPEHAESYAANAAAGAAELAALEGELRRALEPVADRPFIVFHDAYQYFERRFGLAGAGTITVAPDSLPGARRIGELRQHVSEMGVACVFAEPQFEPAIVATIIDGSGARAGMLDPEGAKLVPGPDLYLELLRGLAEDFIDCLSRS